METERPERPLERGDIRYRDREFLALARGWFLAGAVVAVLGFIMPWFKHGPDYSWWYSGLELWSSHNLPGGGAAFFGYIIIALGSAWLLGRDLTWAAVASGLTVVLSFFVLSLIALSLADVGTLYAYWGVGLIPLFLGHATMLIAAIVALVAQLVNALVVGD